MSEKYILNEALIKNYLAILEINSYEELRKLGIDSFWLKKYKRIQSDKIGVKEKETLLIQINNARDNLNDIDLEDLKRFINKDNRKKASNNNANKTKTKKSGTNDSSKNTYQRTEKSPMVIRHPWALTGFFVIVFAGLISIPFIQKQNSYKTANRNQIYEKNNSNLNKKVFEEINYDNGRYEGTTLNGERSGYGKFYNNNGDRYEGKWLNDGINGYGTYYFSDGSRYQGYFLNATKHGKGTFYYSNGDRYAGGWLNDKQNGRGIYYWSDGDRYDGDWLDGNRNGYGTYTYSSGYSEEQYWNDGQLQR